jgi:SAM-dependent methyltransferase
MEENTIKKERVRQHRVADFAHHVLADLRAAERARMLFLGSQLGLYKAMLDGEPMNVGQIARNTGASIKLVKHWVDSLSEDGYLFHNQDNDTFCLPTAHAIALTDPTSPHYIGNRIAKETGRSQAVAVPKLSNGATMGSGLPADASARYFREEYLAALLHEWLPAVKGITERLQKGILVADLSCGRHGGSTLAMASAFPASTFLGFDRYTSSVERANLLAKEKHIGNAHFELATVDHVYAYSYDLVTLIECMHLMGEGMQHLLSECYEVLAPDGVLLIVEAKDGNRISEELYQRLRSFSGTRLQDDITLRVENGNDVRERDLRQAATAAGFGVFRKATETLYNKVYEMRRSPLEA